MTPLPDKPLVVVLVDQTGMITKMATNISPDLRILEATNTEAFNQTTSGLPFHFSHD